MMEYSTRQNLPDLSQKEKSDFTERIAFYMETNELKLIRIDVESAEELWKMQVEAFSSLYEKYQDTDTSPAAEKLDKIQMRLNQPFTYFYFIVVDGKKAGAIRVIDKKRQYN